MLYFAWALALTGCLLIFLEFFLPGAIMAIGGGLLILASLFFFYMADPSLLQFFLYAGFLLFSTFLVIQMVLWKQKGSKKRTISEEPYEGVQVLIYPKEFVGKRGIAATDLKPSGQIWIEEKSFQALSKSGFISKGTEVLVLSGKGTHLFVEPANEPSQSPTDSSVGS